MNPPTNKTGAQLDQDPDATRQIPVAGAVATTTAASSPAPRAAAPRRVRLVVSRVDPWSALKMSFLLSVAAGIILVVAIAVLWLVLSAMGVFSTANELISGLSQSDEFDLLDYISFTRVVSLATIVSVLNVVLITAIGTIFALLYNTAARLVGGLTVTLTDD